jgi:hypothetical protein
MKSLFIKISTAVYMHSPSENAYILVLISYFLKIFCLKTLFIRVGTKFKTFIQNQISTLQRIGVRREEELGIGGGEKDTIAE